MQSPDTALANANSAYPTECRRCHAHITNPWHALMGVCSNCVALSSAAAAAPRVRPAYRFGTSTNGPQEIAPFLD